MDPNEVTRILGTLARGVDPETGAVLREGSPLSSPHVARALSIGAELVSASADESARKARSQTAEQDATELRRAELVTAIEREQLVLHYQPVVDLRSGRMVGAEALMRWKRGDILLPPSEFIPLASEAGLLNSMTAWAIDEAAHQVRNWNNTFGFSNSISVNLLMVPFQNGNLLEQIHQSVSKFGLPHSVIKLELSEHNLMRDLSSTIRTLHALTEIGVEIAIDDFGAGYSSLSHLTVLPVSELKIDRSLVRDLGRAPQKTAVVAAIISMASSLGFRVVAKGVETEQEANELLRLGCAAIQGFFICPAMPPGDLESWQNERAGGFT